MVKLDIEAILTGKKFSWAARFKLAIGLKSECFSDSLAASSFSTLGYSINSFVE